MITENHHNPSSPLLSPALNRKPPNPSHIHLMGICGTGMASLAGILKQEGHHITGSDQNVYPPMSHFLEKLSIPVFEGYGPKNLHPVPDLVIVGNVITRQNPEALELSRLAIPYLSMPQALGCFAMEGKKSIVVCGTHGKTTTSALAACLLERAGLDPSFMVGGIPLNFQGNFKLGRGTFFVIEGDEYDTAFFDKGPKFLHYSPWAVILTSIEFDHADIYRDLDHVKESFRRLIELIPPEGILIANGDDPIVLAESERARCPVVTYGLKDRAEWRVVDLLFNEDKTHLKIAHPQEGTFRLTTSLYGRHNVSNLLSTVVLSRFLGIPPHSLDRACQEFKGVKRRQEIKGERKGILIVDDFAHHPTAVRETLRAVRERYRDRRLIAIFEPRSNSSRRNIFQGEYVNAFDHADLTMIPEPPMMEKIPLEERFSSSKLVEDLKNRGIKALYFPSTDLLLDQIFREGRRGDLILFMSNGSFDHLPERLLQGLEGD